MIRRRRSHQQGLEALLRRQRPEPPSTLVDRLSALVEDRPAPQPVRRWSRAAFAGAVTVFMLGTFASFGGLSYAASSAVDTAEAVKDVLTASSASVRSDSAAADQYGEDEEEGEVEEEVGVAAPPPIVPEVETLPFTGAPLVGTALLGGALVLAGAFLRRRESRRER